MKAKLGCVLASVLCLTAAEGASAATITASEDATAVPSSSFNALPNVSSGVINYVTGDLSGVYRSPFETTAGMPINPQFSTAVYTAIEGGASGTWNFAPSTQLSLFWGSPDSWNRVEFWSGANGTGTDLGGLSGSDLAAYLLRPGMGHDQVSIFMTEAFESVVLTAGLNAFEFTNLTALTPVPIPGSLLLFGMGALGIGGLVLRRRKSAVASRFST